MRYLPILLLLLILIGCNAQDVVGPELSKLTDKPKQSDVEALIADLWELDGPLHQINDSELAHYISEEYDDGEAWPTRALVAIERLRFLSERFLEETY